LKALLFPGQGSQSIGMGKDLYDNFRLVKDLYDRISEEIKLDLKSIIFSGNETDLNKTENVQVAIMITSYALIKVLETEFGIILPESFQYLAGHSLGQYTALTVAKSIDVYTCSKLLRIRGLAMQQAADLIQGAMAAIIGIKNQSTVADILTKSRKEGEICVIANDNGGSQIVISGHFDSIEKAMEEARNHGAKLCVKLNVSGAFHSPLMSFARQIMERSLLDGNIDFQDIKIPVIDNTTAEPISSKDDLKTLLVNQVTGQVRWRESIEFLINNGVNTFIEVGNNKVLTGLMKKIDPTKKAITLSTIQDIDNNIDYLR
jgi:[acyl-carrier-protein] S-malonyltransferase